jgi:hypothetical protein
MASNRFPKVLRQGQTRATIYNTPVRGCDGFTVVWYEGDTRKRKLFSHLDASELHAQAKVISAVSGTEIRAWLQGLDRETSKVDASIAKTNSRRLVPIAQNLKAWLAGHKRSQGPVLELANVVNALNRVVKTAREFRTASCEVRGGKAGGHLTPTLSPSGGEGAGRANDGARTAASGQSSVIGGQNGEDGFRWKHNALRHSFCSYRLAEVKNAAQVSLEAGNSPQMIFHHYRELVTEKEAGAWFGITPEAAKAVRERVEAKRAAKVAAFPARTAA